MILAAAAAGVAARPAPAAKDPVCLRIVGYDAGNIFEGLRAARSYLCEAPVRAPGVPSWVSKGVRAAVVAYERCGADLVLGQPRCARPIQVITYPACLRNRAAYPPHGLPGGLRDLRVRGVPAARDGNGTFLELYTGASTVVIFAPRARQLVVARALRRTGAPASAVRKPLPPPVSGAVEGRLRCPA